MNTKKRLAISNETLKAIHNIYLKHGWPLYVHTINRIFISVGILPGNEIEIGARSGMVKINEIWQPGMLYTQYGRWEDHISDIWSEPENTDFKNITICEN